MRSASLQMAQNQLMTLEKEKRYRRKRKTKRYVGSGCFAATSMPRKP